jgi:AFG3 family protein
VGKDEEALDEKKFKFNSKSDKKRRSKKNPNSSPPGQDPTAALFLLIFILMGIESLRSGSSQDGPEITWQDIRANRIQDIEKLVVVNQKKVRVYLKDGSRGISQPTQVLFSDVTIDEGATKDNDIIASEQNWDDGTKLEFSETSNPKADSDSKSGTGNHRHRQVYHFFIGSVETFEEKLTKTQHDLGMQPRDFISVHYVTETNWLVELIKISPLLFMLGMGVLMFRSGGPVGPGGGSGGIFQVGKSNAKKIRKEDVQVTFADVAGCQEAKKEIMEFVDFLKDSSRFTKLGAKIPKGALLSGPPGTGKTLLAKAVAGEAGVPFYSVSGSDFLEMFVGVGPSRVRDLFQEARSNAPCIIFIDEIDAVGRQRGRGGFSGGNDERENTLNQLLVEMDGFSPSTGVVVLAGTNRPDILDQALLRPGRFDRQITVDRPDLQGRREIFQVHLKGLTLEGTIDEIAGRLAGLTPGFSGADIANLCNEAAIVAARRKGESVALDDFERATDRIVGGLESHKIMSDADRKIVAYHEAGHAVAGWFLEHTDPVVKVTIIPRSSGALGYAQYLPKEIFLRSQDQIMDIICMALAGRAAEEVFLGNVTTGASDDLRRVTQMVYSTIKQYGMNSRVGQLSFPENEDGMTIDKPYSDATARAMDEEARSIVDDAYQRTLALIRDRKAEVEKVAIRLLERETVTHDDIVDLIGSRPYEGDAQYKEFVSSRFVHDQEEKHNETEKGETHDDITLVPS